MEVPKPVAARGCWRSGICQLGTGRGRGARLLGVICNMKRLMADDGLAKFINGRIRTIFLCILGVLDSTDRKLHISVYLWF